MTTIITPPDLNDSFSRIVLLGKEYQIRFTWNATALYWTFGVCDMERRPYVSGVRIVPNSPLNFFYQTNELPDGIFVAIAELAEIGRKDFKSGRAKFLFIPREDLT